MQLTFHRGMSTSARAPSRFSSYFSLVLSSCLLACASERADDESMQSAMPTAGASSLTAGQGGAGSSAGSGTAGATSTAGTLASDAAMDDAASDAGSASDPLETPVGQWTFLTIPGMRCADGSDTGVGVRRNPSSSELVFFFEGGGACWDGATCFELDTAVNIEGGYDAARFSATAGSLSASDPSSPNPLESATAVFVPYCTGDLHGGDAVQTYASTQGSRQVHHVGAANVRALLARLRTGLSEPSRVWITGTSAGGYGAVLNTLRIADAYPNVPSHVLADSSPFVTPVADRYTTWIDMWNLRFPEGCDDCATDFSAVAEHVVNVDPSRRFALLLYSQDAVIAAYFGLSGASLEAEQNTMLDRVSTTQNQARYFVVAGDGHGLLAQPQSTAAPSGATLGDFLLGWLLGLPSFANAR